MSEIRRCISTSTHSALVFPSVANRPTVAALVRTPTERPHRSTLLQLARPTPRNAIHAQVWSRTPWFCFESTQSQSPKIHVIGNFKVATRLQDLCSRGKSSCALTSSVTRNQYFHAVVEPLVPINKTRCCAQLFASPPMPGESAGISGRDNPTAFGRSVRRR